GPRRDARRGDPSQAARSAARVAGRQFGRRWAFTLIMTIAIGAELAPQPQVLAWLYAIAALVILALAAWQWLRLMPCFRAVRLLGTPLTEHPARLAPDQSVAITLPDGVELTGRIVWAANLIANVRASGRLWVAGTPAAGATLGVGVPDFPIAGVVRFNQEGNA